MIEITFIPTPAGKIGVAAEGGSLVKIFFRASDLPERWVRGQNSPVLREAEAQFDAYFRGSLRAFDLPLCMRTTDFTKAVLEQTLAIPYGGLTTYAALAAAVGSPNAARAVGRALNRNPFPIVIPCHRVVGSTGALVGYAGGLGVKTHLLNLEKAHED